MNDLLTWATKHNVSPAAMKELTALMQDVEPPVERSTDDSSEARVQDSVRLKASQIGGRLWRNNVGALVDKRGVPIRYGLCNETKAMNKVLKSSDLIGIYPLKITADMVGNTVGQFWAIECKHEGWEYVGNDHEKAQKAFGDLVVKFGGRFSFIGDMLTPVPKK